MQSKFVLFATTLMLLITAPSTFADATSNINSKIEKAAEDKAVISPAVISPKEESKPDEKSKVYETMPIEGKQPVFYFLADPCLANPNLPGCPGL